MARQAAPPHYSDPDQPAANGGIHGDKEEALHHRARRALSGCRVRRLTGGPGSGAPAAGLWSGSTISARCASARWTRRASISRCSRSESPDAGRGRGEPRSRLASRVNDRLAERARPSRPIRRVRHAADRRPESRGRRARAHGDAARLQGRDGQRPDQRRLARRRAVLADLRARRGARRADLHPPGDAPPAVDQGLLQGLPRGYPALFAPPGASWSRQRRRASAWC